MAALEYRVMSQSTGLAPEVATWSAQALRFFGARLEPGSDATRIRLVCGTTSGERRAVARGRSAEDLAVADAAEARAGGGGLALLARRCPTVWVVEREAEDDAIALRLAAILASVELGPILDPSGPDIFGVKTARERVAMLTLKPDR